MDATQLKQWDADFPIGTRVLAYPAGRDFAPVYTKVRSEAWLLGSGDAVALVDQRAGGVALTHIERSPEPVDVHEEAMCQQQVVKVVRDVHRQVLQMATEFLGQAKAAWNPTQMVEAFQEGQSEEEVMRFLLSRVAAGLGEELITKSEKSLEIAQELKKHREGGQNG